MRRLRSGARLSIVPFLMLTGLVSVAPAQRAPEATDAVAAPGELVAQDKPSPLVAAPDDGPRALVGLSQRPEGLVDWRVTGRVVSATGEPLVGAEVAFVPGLEQLARQQCFPWSHVADHLKLMQSMARTRTVSDGRFVLEVRHPLVSDAYAMGNLQADPMLVDQPDLSVWSLGLGSVSTGFHPQVFVAASGHGATGRIVSLWQGEADVGEIRLGPGMHVKGRLVDQSGAPLAGATVLTSFIEPERDAPSDGLKRFPWSMLGAHFQARTGTDGSFALEGVPIGTPDLQAVTAQGDSLRVKMTGGVRSVSGWEQVLLVGESRSSRLTGRVVDADGEAVVGAIVRLGTLKFGWDFEEFDGQYPGPDGSLPAPVGASETLTDVHGRFALAVAQGRFARSNLHVTAVAAGHPPVMSSRLDADSADLTLQVPPPAAVLLVVRDKDSGQPLHALAGKALLSDMPDTFSEVLPAPVLLGEAACDAARALGIRDLPDDLDPTSCLLVIGIEGATVSVQVQAVGAGTRMFQFQALARPGVLRNLDLPRGHTLRAWVSDGKSTAVPEARFTMAMTWGSPQAVHSGWTDADGWLHLHDLFETNYAVSIRTPGHVPVENFQIGMTQALGQGTFTFPSPPTGAIAGRLHLQEGVNPSGLLVKLVWHDPGKEAWPSWWEKPDEDVIVFAGDDGRFLATGLPSGTWTLTTEAGGFVETHIEWGEFATVDLRVAEPALLRIRLADGDGQPLQGAVMVLDPGGKAHLKDALTRLAAMHEFRDDARFDVHLAAPTRCIVHAMLPSGVVHATELLALEPGEVRDLELRVPGVGGLQVRFVGDDGQPCPTAGLLFDGRPLEPTSRRGDILTFAGLPVGLHALRAVAVDGSGDLQAALKSGAGLGREHTVQVLERGMVRDVVLVAPRPARVTFHWDKDLRRLESLSFAVGNTRSSVSRSVEDTGEPATRSITLDVLPGEYEVQVSMSIPQAGWESSTSIDWEDRDLMKLQIQIKSEEQRVIELHLP